MSKYCEKCNFVFNEERCPVCGKKSGKAPLPTDICFLVEKEQIWGAMLADVLAQHGIPYLSKNVLGAGLSMKIGPMLERVRFYVPYGCMVEAQEIVEELFHSSCEVNQNED